LFSDDFKEYFTTLKLVILSSCHSSWLADKFLNAGVQCVISISSEN